MRAGRDWRVWFAAAVCNKHDDVIDHIASVWNCTEKAGDVVKTGESIATVHYNDQRLLTDALRRLAEAYVIGPKPPSGHRVLVKKIIPPCNNSPAS